MVLKVQWSVRDRGSYGWVSEDCPPRWYPTSLAVLGQIRIAVHIRELHLVLQIMVVTRLFPCVDYRWWPIIGGTSRHSWQQWSINVIIKGCRIKRCPGEDVNLGFDGWGFIRVMGFKLSSYRVQYFFLFELTLYVCVWRWSCNSLHEKQMLMQVSMWILRARVGPTWEFLHGNIFMDHFCSQYYESFYICKTWTYFWILSFGAYILKF